MTSFGAVRSRNRVGRWSAACAVVAGVVVALASGPVMATPVTFAQFQEASGAPPPLSFTAQNSTTATFGTDPAGAPVVFTFLQGSINGSLPSQLVGPLAARLVVSATATGPDNFATQASSPRIGLTDLQFLDSLTLSFVLDTPVNGLSNLLTVSVASIGNISPYLTGSEGAHAASLSASTVGSAPLTISYSSDFLTFGAGMSRDFALSLTALTPVLFYQGPNNFLADFTADVTGTFDAEPPPSTIREPGSLALFGAGIILLTIVPRVRRAMRSGQPTF